jgi:hypothetical protein
LLQHIHNWTTLDRCFRNSHNWVKCS